MPSASQRRENLPILRANSCRDRSFPVAYLQDSRDGKGYPQSRLLCLHLGVARMLKAKRERRERTDNYHLLQQWCRTPEQRLYARDSPYHVVWDAISRTCPGNGSGGKEPATSCRCF